MELLALSDRLAELITAEGTTSFAGQARQDGSLCEPSLRRRRWRICAVFGEAVYSQALALQARERVTPISTFPRQL